jgi:HEAT repeat protein
MSLRAPWQLILLVTTVGWGIGCTQAVAPPENTAMSVEAHVQLLLYGAEKTCDDDTHCGGTVCHANRCLGVLAANEPWLQKRVAKAVAKKLLKEASLRSKVLELLSAGLKKDHPNVAKKARALPLLEELEETGLLSDVSESTHEALGAQAALALCRLGKRDTLNRCAALTESDDLAVAVDALHALGRSGQAEALAPLMRTLNPELDRMLLRAAIEALGLLKDPRSIRPLVTFHGKAPEFLIDSTTRVLRSLTGASHGQRHTAWTDWVRTNRPVEAPDVELRVVSSEAILGIPEP